MTPTDGKVIVAIRKRYTECPNYTEVAREFGYKSRIAIKHIIDKESYEYIDDNGNDTRPTKKGRCGKLCDDAVMDIRRNCKHEQVSEYAEKYGVDRKTINSVLTYKIHNYEALRV